MRKLQKCAVILTVSLVLLAVLGGDYFRNVSISLEALRNFRTEIFNGVESPKAQWLIALCLGSNLVAFQTAFIMGLRRDCVKTRSELAIVDVAFFVAWNIVLLGSVLAYVVFYPAASSTSDFIVWICGITILWASKTYADYSAEPNCSLDSWAPVAVNVLILILCASTLGSSVLARSFYYHGHVRWNGLWQNPNTAGLLAGLGLILCVAQLQRISNKRLLKYFWPTRASMWLLALTWVWLAAASIILCRGLLRSYSRGAWVATGCGFVFWGQTLVLPKASDLGKWILRNQTALMLGLASFLVIFMWQFRHSESLLCQRLWSVVDWKDYSWQNRMEAWRGSLEIMSDHPLLGLGWDRTEIAYEYFYRIPPVEAGMAIQLNNYGTLGATAGIPVLVCFLFGVSLCLWPFGIARRAFTKRSTSLVEPGLYSGRFEGTRTAFRSAIILLLVGFWFDGGLFNLATSVPFWVMLGAIQSDERLD